MKRMRVSLITVGSLGDVRPFIALGHALAQEGHHIRLSTHRCYEALVRSRGLDFAPVESDPRELLEGRSGQDWVRTGGNPVRFVSGLVEVTGDLLPSVMRDCWRACEGTEVVVASILGFLVAYHVAEKLQVPIVSAYLQPVTRSSAFPACFFPEAPAWLGVGRTFYNRSSHAVVEQVFWQLLRRPINRARADILGLPPISFVGPFSRFAEQRIPMLYGYSPSVLPKPPDWGHHISVTGYWFLDHSDEWRPPAGLEDFIASGSPPVYVGFGSMSNRDPEETASVVVKALALCGARGVLATGWGGLSQSDLSDTVFRVEQVSHEWLFPRMAAVVHHGGAGTTASGLRAGVPSIIVPYFSDQPFWGRRVYELGVGPKPIPRRALSAERLADAIRIASSDTLMKQRAVALSRHIQAEDGLKLAVEAFNHHVSGFRSAPGT